MSTINESRETTINPAPTEPAPRARVGRRLRFDEHGHALPLTDEEMAEYRAGARIALEALASIPDDPDEVSDEEFWRAIDEGRPERPLFKELYEP